MDGLQGKDRRQNQATALEPPEQPGPPPQETLKIKVGVLLLRFSADERHLLLDQY